MNLPNKLTVLRVIMIPFFVAALMAEGGENPAFRYAAAAIFIIASLTDMLDGKIARKYNLVTNFGKFMDPLADKLLVCSALICMIELGQLPAWMVIIIISREFIISGFRLVAADRIVDLKYRSAVHDNGGCGLDRPDPDGGVPGGLYCKKYRHSYKRRSVGWLEEKV